MADPAAISSAVDISVQRIAQDTQKAQAEELLAPLAQPQQQPLRSDAAAFSPEALAMLANQTGSTGTSFTA